MCTFDVSKYYLLCALSKPTSAVFTSKSAPLVCVRGMGMIIVYNHTLYYIYRYSIDI